MQIAQNCISGIIRSCWGLGILIQRCMVPNTPPDRSTHLHVGWLQTELWWSWWSWWSWAALYAHVAVLSRETKAIQRKIQVVYPHENPALECNQHSFAGILQTHILSPLFLLRHSNDTLWIYNILFVAKYYLGCLLVLILSVFILFLKVNGVNLLKVHANWLMVACYWRSHYSSVWTTSAEKVAPMKQPRTAAVVASLNHKVYGIGGECAKTPRETHYLKSVELYDPMHNTWDVSQGGYLMEMKKSRSPSPDQNTHLPAGWLWTEHWWSWWRLYVHVAVMSRKEKPFRERYKLFTHMSWWP